MPLNEVGTRHFWWSSVAKYQPRITGWIFLKKCFQNGLRCPQPMVVKHQRAEIFFSKNDRPFFIFFYLFFLVTWFPPNRRTTPAAAQSLAGASAVRTCVIRLPYSDHRSIVFFCLIFFASVSCVHAPHCGLICFCYQKKKIPFGFH